MNTLTTPGPVPPLPVRGLWAEKATESEPGSRGCWSERCQNTDMAVTGTLKEL